MLPCSIHINLSSNEKVLCKLCKSFGKAHEISQEYNHILAPIVGKYLGQKFFWGFVLGVLEGLINRGAFRFSIFTPPRFSILYMVPVSLNSPQHFGQMAVGVHQTAIPKAVIVPLHILLLQLTLLLLLGQLTLLLLLGQLTLLLQFHFLLFEFFLLALFTLPPNFSPNHHPEKFSRVASML